MNNDRILDQIRNNSVSGATLDFSDLMSRIEKDGGRSTADVMHIRPSAGKIIGTAASVVLAAGASAALLGVLAVAATGGMAAAESDCALDSPMVMEDTECWFGDSSAQDDMESSEPVYSEMTTDGDAEESVSDGDVSDSDVSGSDLPEGNSHD